MINDIQQITLSRVLQFMTEVLCQS